MLDQTNGASCERRWWGERLASCVTSPAGLRRWYGAGRLESRNIVEYETAARYARDCGRSDLIDCLLTMAEVEWEHERYFRSCVLRHRWSKRFTIWPEPPPKESIRNHR